MLEKKSIRQLKYSDNVMLTQLCKLQYYSLIHTFNKKWRCLLLPYIYTSNSACSFFFFSQPAFTTVSKRLQSLLFVLHSSPIIPTNQRACGPAQGGTSNPRSISCCSEAYFSPWMLIIQLQASPREMI